MDGLFYLVEVTGLEPAASWSQTKHSTKLSYAPICFASFPTAFILYYIKIHLSILFSKKLIKNFD